MLSVPIKADRSLKSRRSTSFWRDKVKTGEIYVLIVLAPAVNFGD
jgi:hypothetical protein